MQFETLVDRPVVPAGKPSVRHLLVRLHVPERPRDKERRPLNLALILDRSGSMGGEKLRLAKCAPSEAIRLLSSPDRVAITVYDDQIDTVFPSSFATPPSKVRATEAIGGVEAGNSTNLCGGYLTGCKQVADTFEEGSIGRALLLTDGLANEGVTDEDTIVGHSRALRERGLVTSAFGVGKDFNERLLRRMADEGGGNFYFAYEAAQIPDHIAGEVQDSLDIVCPAAVLSVHHEPEFEPSLLNTFRRTRETGLARFHLGALVSGQHLDLILRIQIPALPEGKEPRLQLSFNPDEKDESSLRLPDVVFASVSGSEVTARKPDFEVLRAAARLDAAEARMSALEKNNDARYEEAGTLVTDAARKIDAIAEGDPEILGVAGELRGEYARMTANMDAFERKASYFGYKRALVDRNVKGGARRTSGWGRVIGLLSTEADIRLVLRNVLAGPIGAARSRALTVEALQIGPILPPLANAHVLTREEERQLVLSARSQLGTDVLTILFVAQNLEDAWFSHWHPAEEMAVASLAGWESHSSAPREAFVGYEIVLHGLRGFPGWDPETVMHQASRGCPFDFCGTKSDIDQKLHVFELCRPCCDALQKHGIPLAEVQEFARAIRMVVETQGNGGRPRRKATSAPADRAN